MQVRFLPGLFVCLFLSLFQKERPMIIYNRKVGQSVHIGEAVLTVENIVFNTVLISFKSPTVTLKAGLAQRTYIEIGDILISFHSIHGQNKARLGLTVPKEIKLIRGEKLTPGVQS